MGFFVLSEKFVHLGPIIIGLLILIRRGASKKDQHQFGQEIE